MQKVTLIMMIVVVCFSQGLHAHSEHDKARFVASNGTDQGDCKNRFRPCKTISYAVQHANKGDKVLVAEGQYNVSSASEVFDLLGALVPVKGGYNKVDSYRIQNPDRFTTTLVGVPSEYASILSGKGFNVIVDRKGMSQDINVDFSSLKLMQERQPAAACVNGKAAGFTCNNVSLLAHVPLSEFPNSVSSANDIWGHIDLNTQKEYAIIGFNNGLSVVDVSQPDAPVIAGSISGIDTSWRDFKVYQFYHEPTARWRAYAYSTAEPSRSGRSEGLTIVDLNELPNKVSLVTRQLTDSSAHNVYISNVDYGLNIALPGMEAGVQIVGSNNLGGALRTYSLRDPKILGSTYSPPAPNPLEERKYTHDASSLWVTDSRKDTDCKLSAQSGCSVLLDFNEKQVFIWSQTDDLNTVELLGEVTYPNADYTHSGWWTEDKQYVIVHDETDEQSFGLNTTLNILDISSLTNPTLVGTWTGPTRAIDHNGFVRGNRYYMSNYTRGMTVLDITDPTKPMEIGMFDTFPGNDGANFNGAWGVYPFLPSGVLLVSDINSGLYILKDETLTSDVGTVSFGAKSMEVEEGQNATIEVQKTGNGIVQVGYEILTGSADGSDVTVQTGELNWGAADTDSQSISVSVLNDQEAEPDEVFFVRLFNPRNGATLGQPNLITVTINGIAQRGSLGFASEDITVKEIDSSLMVNVSRMSGSQETVSIDYALVSDSGEAGVDALLDNGILTWQDGDTADKSITINIVNDELTEQTETLFLQLSSDDSALVGANSRFTIHIRDDESNQAPTAMAGDDFEVNTRQTVELKGAGRDPEGNDISYLWEQVSGTSVTLQNPTNAQTEFTAPTEAGTLEFSLTITDDFAVKTTDNIMVTVKAVAATPTPAPTPPAPTPTQPSSSSGGGSLNWMWLWMLFIVLGIRQVRIKP